MKKIEFRNLKETHAYMGYFKFVRWDKSKFDRWDFYQYLPHVLGDYREPEETKAFLDTRDKVQDYLNDPENGLSVMTPDIWIENGDFIYRISVPVSDEIIVYLFEVYED